MSGPTVCQLAKAEAMRLPAFRDGDIRELVATHVAARGIDIPGVAYVYSYELENVPDNCVRRVGRTARAGAAGRVIAFCNDDEIGPPRSIETVLGEAVRVAGGMAWRTRRSRRSQAQVSRPPPIEQVVCEPMRSLRSLLARCVHSARSAKGTAHPFA